jgi:hypothetical protein
MPLQSPVLFLIFNRPDKTKQVFEAIRHAQPDKLFVAADGPRKDRIGEQELCKQTREIISAIDWKCELKTLYRSENLGCKVAVSSAINWFFENVEEGIILEDDCLPNQSFFLFCERMLNEYRVDQRIMHIGGSNFQDGLIRENASYYFSSMFHIWGWATWRRAWKFYDIEMKGLNSLLNIDFFESIFKKRSHQEIWKRMFNAVETGKSNTWDYQWTLSCWLNNGLSVIPNTNLVSNIGYDGDATHTSLNEKDILSNKKIESLVDIISPNYMIRNYRADCYTMDKYFIKNKKNDVVLNIINRLNR